MTLNATHEEPTLTGILACLRRILIEEENARRQTAAPGGKPLLLSDMICPDGTVVKISPQARAERRETSEAPLRDPFLRFDILKGRVAVLLSPERPDAAACRTVRSRRRAAVRKEATQFVAPAQIAGRIQETSARPNDSDQAPVSGDVNVPSLAANAEVSRLTEAGSLASIPFVDQDQCGTPDTMPAPIAPAGVRAQSTLHATRLPAHLDPENGSADMLQPANQIERMLAQQMAAACQAVLTLTGAAIQTIHNEAKDGETSEIASRSGCGRLRIRVKRDPGAKAARLVNSAARMMQSYNSALTTLAMLRGAPPASTDRSASRKRRDTALIARIHNDEGESPSQNRIEKAKRKRPSSSLRRRAKGARTSTH